MPGTTAPQACQRQCRAREPLERERTGAHLSCKNTTMNQIEGQARSSSAARDANRLQMLYLRRQESRIGRKLREHTKVMTFLGENDVPCVRRVLGQALKDGKSPIAMLGTLEAAFPREISRTRPH
ncbi:unnamed protein product [Ectocarpus sp. 12 AP-2014]